MATVLELPAPNWTVTRLCRHFGNIAASRIHHLPVPGTAQESHAIHWNEARLGAACELVDGCLVEKIVGIKESLIAGVLLTYINIYLQHHSVGFAVGEQGAWRMFPGLIRIPDVSFISWETLGGEEVPDKPVLNLAPDLAVEVISKGNTRAEMARKVQEYFAGGSKLVWLVYPKRKSVDVFTGPEEKRTVKDILDGGDVLPGFSLPLDQLFGAGTGRRSK